MRGVSKLFLLESPKAARERSQGGYLLGLVELALKRILQPPVVGGASHLYLASTCSRNTVWQESGVCVVYVFAQRLLQTKVTVVDLLLQLP